MTAVAAPATAPPSVAATEAGGRPRFSRWIGLLVIIGVILFVWEAAKFIAGDPWRINGELFGIPINFFHQPPLDWRLATDQSLPHIWEVFGTLTRPVQPNGPALASLLLDNATVHVQRRSHRLRARRKLRPRSRDPPVPGPDPRASPGAVCRDVADDPDHRRGTGHRHRPARRRLLCRPRRGLPDVLPGHDRRSARPSVCRPAGDRADALSCRNATARFSGRSACRLRRRTSSRPSRSRPRPPWSARSWVSCRRASAKALAARCSTSTSTTRSRPNDFGRRSCLPRRRASWRSRS